MIYKPEKKVFSVINCCILQLVEGHHLNVCSWLLCSLPLFSNNNQKKTPSPIFYEYLFIHFLLFFFTYISFPPEPATANIQAAEMLVAIL